MVAATLLIVVRSLFVNRVSRGSCCSGSSKSMLLFTLLFTVRMGPRMLPWLVSLCKFYSVVFLDGKCRSTFGRSISRHQRGPRIRGRDLPMSPSCPNR